MLKNYGGYFDFESKQVRMHQLESQMGEVDFWSDKKNSEKVIAEFHSIKNMLEKVKSLRKSIVDSIEMIDLLRVESNMEMQILIDSECPTIENNIEELKVQLLLNKPYDMNDAILEIHPGAGGTEACDWAYMLYRMYSRWCEKKQFKLEVLEEQVGEEAGIKSVMMIVKGVYAFGYLKHEKGVHRLIRLSPFDANSRRHTSFASVDVTPVLDSSIHIDIKESDLRIDVYRSSGCGGQGVNTTDSAVRITHLPTKIVVTCQNERSQIQNKEKALEVLKSKLYQLEMEKRDAALKEMKKDNMDINFGSQVRSYIMHPYSLVKDHRINTETSNVYKVLDGDIDLFIYENLKRG